MGKYFGTDGVRGQANVELTAAMAFSIGRALGEQCQGEKIVVGMDTRRSGSMLMQALSAGACASGADVYQLGVVSTPCVAYLVSHEDFSAGVMISASHNPYYDNGIKIFNHQGIKIDDAIEAKLEEVIDGRIVPYAMLEAIGQIYAYSEGLEKYRQYLLGQFKMDLSGFKIAVDAANGSAISSAKAVLEALHADVVMMNDQANGLNINVNAGSTHPEGLQAFVRENGCDIGLAFDGDADRLIAVDHEGNLVNGDHILYIGAKFFKEHHQLRGNTVVTTVMANLGLHRALKRLDIDTVQTQVGDKYVYEKMLEEDYIIGGEQSGHIIFKDFATTGDGLLTALMLLKMMYDKQSSLKDLCSDLVIYPQLLKNVKVKDKKAALENQSLQEAIAKAEADLKGEGRVLVRPSGTEPLVRVMVEASTEETCQELVESMLSLIEALGL